MSLIKIKKKGEELREELLDDALEGVLYQLDKNGIAEGRKADEWIWSKNILFESFLVSFAQKRQMFQGIAVRPTYNIRGAGGVQDWTTFQTPIFDNWKDAKNELIRYISSYHKSKNN